MTFSFIHCADLHLDAVLGDSVRASASDQLSSDERNTLLTAPIASFERVVEQAIINKVDTVVIAGDIFDSKDSSAKDQRTRSRFTALLQKLNDANIRVFITLGNHDPIRSISKLSASWPDNVHVFSSAQPETITWESDDTTIAIHGVSYERNDEDRLLVNDFPSRVNNAINIGVLHTNVGGDEAHKNYAPSTIAALTSHHYDYFALGHVHKRVILNDAPHVAYSGNTQGLSAKPSEQEPKGCVLVSIEPSTHVTTTRFIETDSVRYITCPIRADEFLETDDIVTYAADVITQACTDREVFYLVRATIDVFGTLDAEQICLAINDQRNNFFVTSLSTVNSYRSFSELVEQDAFYATVRDVLSETELPSLEDLYGPRASAISRYLDDEPTEYKEAAADSILAIASDIERRVRK